MCTQYVKDTGCFNTKWQSSVAFQRGGKTGSVSDQNDLDINPRFLFISWAKEERQESSWHMDYGAVSKSRTQRGLVHCRILGCSISSQQGKLWFSSHERDFLGAVADTGVVSDRVGSCSLARCCKDDVSKSISQMKTGRFPGRWGWANIWSQEHLFKA